MNLVFHETAKPNLIFTGHADELDTETASLTPADLRQPYMEWSSRVWCQHPHLQVGTGLNSLPALDSTPGDGDVDDRSFSHTALTRKDDRKIRVHTRTVAELDHRDSPPFS
jgi:hypothetical protein